MAAKAIKKNENSTSIFFIHTLLFGWKKDEDSDKIAILEAFCESIAANTFPAWVPSCGPFFSILHHLPRRKLAVVAEMAPNAHLLGPRSKAERRANTRFPCDFCAKIRPPGLKKSQSARGGLLSLTERTFFSVLVWWE